jgi:hypothetical protein
VSARVLSAEVDKRKSALMQLNFDRMVKHQLGRADMLHVGIAFDAGLLRASAFSGAVAACMSAMKIILGSFTVRRDDKSAR